MELNTFTVFDQKKTGIPSAAKATYSKSISVFMLMVILQLQSLQSGLLQSHFTNGAVSIKLTEQAAQGSPLQLKVGLPVPFISIDLTSLLFPFSTYTLPSSSKAMMPMHEILSEFPSTEVPIYTCFPSGWMEVVISPIVPSFCN